MTNTGDDKNHKNDKSQGEAGKAKVTAGRDSLGTMAPDFARYNDDILFGEVWENKDLSPRERSIITITSLITSGIFDSSLSFHLKRAKENGRGVAQIGALLTHLGFYAGWPKAWALSRLAKEIWAEDIAPGGNIPPPKGGGIFPPGEPNTAYSKWFTGNSYLKILTTEGATVAHVTFEPGCRNFWHIHSKSPQILIVTEGKGYLRENGEEARALFPGDTVTIRPGTKHWHGAAPDSWFSHLSLEIPVEGSKTEWLEEVTDEEYGKLEGR
jgi:4-carboxymuconolactone decarboxylase